MKKEDQEKQEAAASEQEHNIPKFIEKMSKMVDMDPKGYQHIIKDIAKKSIGRDLSQAEFSYFMSVAAKYELDPMVREIYCFIKKVKNRKTGKYEEAGIQIAVEHDGWIKIVNRQAEYDGMELTYQIDPVSNNLVAATAKFHVKGRSHPVATTVYLNEFRRKTPTWDQMPKWMLGVRAFNQGARRAFGLGIFIDPDEAAKWVDMGLLQRHVDGGEDESPSPPPEDQAPEILSEQPGDPIATKRSRGYMLGLAKTGGADEDMLKEFLEARGTPYDTLTQPQVSDLIDSWKTKDKEGNPKEADYSELEEFLLKKGVGVPVDEDEGDTGEQEEPETDDSPLLTEARELEKQGASITSAMAEIGTSIMKPENLSPIEMKAVIKIMKAVIKEKKKSEK
jgi:hypothetical protein